LQTPATKISPPTYAETSAQHAISIGAFLSRKESWVAIQHCAFFGKFSALDHVARRAAGIVALAILGGIAFLGGASGQTIGSGSTTLISSVSTSATPAFQGGTLEIDKAGTYANNFTLQSGVTTSTIDLFGKTSTLSGIISDATSGSAGSVIITDSVGGGAVTLTAAHTFTGTATINSGALVYLAGSGSFATASSVAVDGTLDVTQTTSGASLISLSGGGSVVLGGRNLALSSASGAFTGVISGTGMFILDAGTEVLGGANTYTGGTTINAGTLQVGTGSSGSIIGNVVDSGTLAFNRNDSVSFDGVISGTGGVSQIGAGGITLTAVQTYSGATTISAGTLALGAGASIANSSSVTVTGTFDISATSGTSIKSLSGAGTVQLGSQTLTFTSASGVFSGVIAGSGGIVMAGGTQTLTGLNTYSGATIVTGGTLRLGSSTITNNITDNATVSFYSGSAVAMSGVISGSGTVSQTGAGVTTLSAVQTYTGATVISAGTLALSGSASIAASSGVAVDGTFDISGSATASSITTLSGGGAVQLGAQTLILTAASGTFSGTISGTGGLTLAAGTETVAGINSFTGITTITSGTLLVANSAGLAQSAKVVDNAILDISGATNIAGAQSASLQSLSGSGTVVLGNRTLVLTNAGDTFSGTISGAGGITVSGGTQSLSGANSYTGVTTISGGILAITGGGSLAATGTVVDNGTFDISAANGPTVTFASLAGSGTVVLGSNSLNLAGGTGTFSGILTGSGGLVISGGTQILSGANNYTGGTTIVAGTLQLGDGRAVGTILGNVTDNGTLAFNRTDSFTFSGAISGSGGIRQIGGGTVILTATNSYTGGTVIAAGTLQIGNGGTTGAITGDVADTGILAFDRSDAVTFGGLVSGTGGLSQIGSGSLTLTAVNTYTGTTRIASGGTLVLGGTGSITSSSDVIDNGVFDVSSGTIAPRIVSLGGSGLVTMGSQSLIITNGSDSFSGVISGSGGLTVAGGTQTLSGANTYTGATAITGGTLAVTGSIASSSGVTVASGGTLSGSGTVSAVSVASGGTVAPGSAGAGTLTANGGVNFASGSNFLVNMSSSAAPSLSASGAASLAGTLSVVSSDGTYKLGQKLAVLSAAGGISGTFTAAPIQSSGAQFSSTLSYDANNVYLEVDLAKLSPLLPSDASRNAINAVAGIDAAIAAKDTLPLAFQNLGNLSSAALGTNAQALAGEIGADIPQAGAALLHPFLNAIFDHMGEARSGRGAWLTGFGGSDLAAGNPETGSQKLSSRVTGFAAGADWPVSQRLTLGAAASFASNDFHLGGGMGTGRVDAFQAGVYGVMHFSPRLYGSFAGLLALDDVTTSRSLTVSGSDTLAGKLSPLVLGGRYETGIRLGSITPYFALEDFLIHTPSYGETAASGASTFALQYDSHTSNSANLELGVRQNGHVALDRFWTLTLSDRLAWSHAGSAPDSATAQFVALPDSDFTTYGAKPGSDAALVSFGANLRNRKGLGLSLHFESAVSAHSQSYTGLAGLDFAW
jgi:autotransporter-associated beta strand protein